MSDTEKRLKSMIEYAMSESSKVSVFKKMSYDIGLLSNEMTSSKYIKILLNSEQDDLIILGINSMYEFPELYFELESFVL